MFATTGQKLNLFIHLKSEESWRQPWLIITCRASKIHEFYLFFYNKILSITYQNKNYLASSVIYLSMMNKMTSAVCLASVRYDSGVMHLC